VPVSVVVPTRGRRAAVCALVERLQEQQPAGGGLEVVVALDGDLDGTEAALRALEVPRPPVLVRLPSTGRDAAHGHGAGPTRNAGAARATGEVLLFLDDDVRPLRPDLVARHARGHAGARRALVGTIVGEPAAGDRFLTRVVDDWWRAQTRHVEQDRALSFTDVSTGNLSVDRATFLAVGGFRALDRHEDWDLGLRLAAAGVEIRHLPDAAVAHRLDTDLPGYLADVRREGSADVALLEAHPEACGALLVDAYRHADAPRRALLRAAARARGSRSAAVAAGVLTALERAGRYRAWSRGLRVATLAAYWAGVGAAAGSVERLETLLARAAEAGRRGRACLDLDTGELRLPGPGEACEVRVLSAGSEVGVAPLRWAGRPFDRDRFVAHVRRVHGGRGTRSA
jgi:glycosyltransferase involved in cell wall biosynthesis